MFASGKTASASSGASSANYIEDVFSTYLYTGNDTSQSITNNIDLSTKGGLVWIKGRAGYNGAQNHAIFDTARGANKWLSSNTTDAENTSTTNFLNAFNTTGFSITSTGNGRDIVNDASTTFASWTFRKQPKFFDVVTYTGDGSSSRTIAHSLGSTPGMVVIKSTSAAGSNWIVWHRGLTGTNPWLLLNTDYPLSALGNYGVSLAPSSTTFTCAKKTSTAYTTNDNGSTYVAYLFAHDAGGFGPTATDNVISCGSFTTDASAIGTANLGYEPQWILLKASGAAQNWFVFDSMRGMTALQTSTFSNAFGLNPNTSAAEVNYGAVNITSTGFATTSGALNANTSYIYIAIRRGPMKVPTSGTSVFTPVTRSGTNANTTSTAGFPVDWGMTGARTGDVVKFANVARLIGNPVMFTSSTNAEVTSTLTYQSNPFDSNTALKIGSTSAATNASGDTFVDYMFRRAPSFFDEVCYTGNDVLRTINHNLGVAPEMMIIKIRDSALDWAVYHTGIGNTKYIFLNSTAASVTASSYWNNTSPTASVFTVNTSNKVNSNPSPYVAYLFATCAGVSKVGSYTGNGSSQTINCGFTGGARFVLIKRTDSTGDWYVWDTARGIVSANDPHLSLNTTAAEVTTDDTIDTDSTGFIVNQVTATNVNVSSATYIYLAIA